MIKKINYTFLAFILCVAFIWNACEQDEVLNELPEIYGEVEGVSINPGRYRIELELENKYTAINSFKIDYWPGLLTGKAKSVEVPAAGNTTSKLIEGLEEDIYTFDITAKMKDGTSKHIGQPKGRSYGTAYEKVLANRKLLQYTFESLTTGKTVWDEIPAGLVYSEVVYLSDSGVVTEKLTTDETEVNIDNFAGDHIAYRSMFVPDETAIDTFKALYDTLVVVPAVPTEPYPVDGYLADLKPELIWKNSLGTVKGILYLGEDSTTMVPVDTLTKAYFQSEELIQNRKYFWRVDPVSDVGFSQKGEVWSFETKTVDKATITAPTTGNNSVSLLPVVTWESADYIKAHNIYLGTSADELTLIGEKISSAFYVPGVLQGNQKYFMRIDAIGGDLEENIAIGDVVEFSTANGGFVNFHRNDKEDLPGACNYVAAHENAATFTEQYFDMFGTTVTLAPSWADDAKNTCMQMIHRGYHNYPDLYMPKFFGDWIGSDTRQPGNPFTLTIKGLPAGEYSWRSWHFDTDNQTGAFNVIRTDVNGEELVAEAFDIKDKSKDFKDKPKEFTAVPTWDMPIVSNGTDDVKITFQMVYPYGTSVIYKFFVMNGFEIIKN